MKIPLFTRMSLGKVGRWVVNSDRAILPGETGEACIYAFFDSSQEAFHRITPQLGGQYLHAKLGWLGDWPEFLIVIHNDLNAEAYIGCVPVAMAFRAKRNIQAGTQVPAHHLADITEAHIEGVKIVDSDSIIYCFRHDWRFGLYFDLGPSLRKDCRKSDLAKELGAAYRHLMFFDDYAGARELHDKGLENDGWFPFVELLGREFISLIDAYRDSDQKVALLQSFLKKFDKGRLEEFIKYWWDDDVLESKKEIIMAGVDAYLTDSQSGFIAAIKTLYSEIEGVVRLKYCAENNTGNATFNQLYEYVHSKAASVYDFNSLAFPNEFYRYIREQVFANFDVKAGNIPLSRHSSAHGVAGAHEYTKARALQAILTLDQLRQFLK